MKEGAAFALSFILITKLYLDKDPLICRTYQMTSLL